MTEPQPKRLDNALQDTWRARGWVSFDALLPESVVERLPAWVNDIDAPPRSPTERRLHYFEETERGPVICRTERYLDDHAQLRELLCNGLLPDMAAHLLGEPAVLYKEKVNYKQPGGAGFAPHQDATAYRFVRRHVTCLVAVDPMTEENGCLEFARGRFDDILEDNGDGCLPSAAADRLQWQPARVPRGGVIFFSSLVPHRSGPNRSACPRRALYLTYNALSEGDLRERYYAAREREMRGITGSSSRISNIGHFQGRSPRDGLLDGLVDGPATRRRQ